MHSIRAKLLLAVLSTLMGTFFISTFANINLVGNTVQQQIDDHALTLVRERGNYFSQFMLGRQQEIENLSRRPELISGEIQDRVDFLNQQRNLLGRYERLYYLDRDTGSVYSHDKTIAPTSSLFSDFSDYASWTTPRPRISPAYPSKDTNANVIAIAYPIFDSTRASGYLIATLTLNSMRPYLGGISVEGERVAYIVDNSGTVLVAPEEAPAGINILQERPLNAIREQSSGKTRAIINGQDYSLYFTRLGETSNWTLVYSISDTVLSEPLVTTRNWLLFSNLLAVALVGGVIYLVADAITRPLRQMVQVLGEIATGDLTRKVEATGQDEVGQTARYANIMADGLAGIIKELKTISQTIVTSCQQIAASIEESTSGLEQSSNLATEIGSNMQLNAASVDQTKNSAQYVANSAQGVSRLTEEAANECATAVHQATTGSQAVADVAAAMSEISRSSEQVNQLVENLIDSSQRIEDMLELITQISEQTNLLSLNAAIEAARAGEMGQGFAVVASEVRKLATRSTHAVEEIGQLVEDIRRKVNSTSQAVGHSNSIIHQAEDRSRVTMSTIQSMVSSINSVEMKIRRVAEAAADQAVTSNAIREAVSNIAASTQETSAGAEELGATLEEQVAILADIENTVSELSGMVQALDLMMRKFRLN